MARMDPADRKAAILDAALKLAQTKGFAALRLQHIADAAECSNATVVGYFKTMIKMRRAVMRAAVTREILPIIAEGIATRDPVASKVSPELRARAVAALRG